VSADASASVRSSADWKDEVVATGLRVGERPVFIVAGVSGALEGQRQHSIVVRH